MGFFDKLFGFRKKKAALGEDDGQAQYFKEDFKPVKKVEAKPEKMAETKTEKKAEPKVEKKEIEHLDEIGIEDFFKCELRCGKVLECEKVKKSKKLLKLKVDMGDGVRQIVSGIALYYTPEEMIGKKVIVVANLKKAVLCGEESYGMILAGGEENVKVAFLDDAVEVGARIS